MADHIVVPADGFAGGFVDVVEGRVGVLDRHRHRPAAEIGKRHRFDLWVEPLVIEGFERAVFFHLLKRGVDRFNEIAAGREDERQLLVGGEFGADLEHAGVLADEA